MENKLFWGASEISDYSGVSKAKAYQFMSVMRNEYEIDSKRCLSGKIPKAIVLDFFKPNVKKKS